MDFRGMIKSFCIKAFSIRSFSFLFCNYRLKVDEERFSMKKRRFKRLVSLLLALSMTISLVPGVPAAASAGGTGSAKLISDFIIGKEADIIDEKQDLYKPAFPLFIGETGSVTAASSHTTGKTAWLRRLTLWARSRPTVMTAWVMLPA